MKTILCYGDSNTWGANPNEGGRYPKEQRWTTVLGNELGSDYDVIVEGLGGRTTVYDDPIEGAHKNGRAHFLMCLESHQPLDLTIILLGTNDLKQRFNVSAFDIAEGAGVLAEIARHVWYGPVPVLLICPPATEKVSTNLEEMFVGAYEKSRQLAPNYRRVAEQHGCGFLDLSTVIASSKTDGIHWDASALPQVAHAVAAAVRQMLE